MATSPKEECVQRGANPSQGTSELVTEERGKNERE